MDSPKDSPSLRNSVRLNADIERNRNYRSSSLNLRQRDSEILQPSTSNQSGNIVHFNGPQRNHMNSLPGNEGTSQNSRYNENTSERNKNSKTTQHQTQICNNIVDKAHSESDSAVPDNSSAIVNSYDNGVDSQEDTPSCQRHKICTDQAGNSSGNVASTSSGRPTENKDSNFRENRKRPSSLKLNRVEDDSSSDTGNDDYSLGSEDGCIYTYRGGEHLADLPSSFFSLDMGLPLDHHLPLPNYPVPQAGAAPLREQGSRASSPDMEFLEMDFDPGPSCEVDSGDESSPDVDLEIAGNMVEEIQPAIIRGTSPEYVPSATLPNPISFATATAPGSRGDSNDLYSFSVPSTSHSTATGPTEVSEITTSYSFGQFITHVNTRGEELLVRRTMAHGHVNVPISLHIACGDLVTPREMLNLEEDPHGYQINQGSTLDSVNLSSAVYHVTMAKKLTAEKANSEVEAQAIAKSGETSCNVTVETGMRSATSVALPRCMIWSESEACERQVTQIATSACGATAVVNVFNALGVPVNLERINSAVGTRQRANNAPLARYLLSRAVAGCTAADLVSGIHRASDGLVTARFFPTYPERAVSLSLWLADWITLGAVPILTLNLQAGYEGEMPDAWHHQMVFGVWARRIYLCNPVESIRENVLWPRLISPSVLLVRSRDVLSRFTVETDLTPLAVVPDQRFHTFNVLGQVANVIREYRATGWGNYGTRTRHIQIPAAYQAGVTIAALTGSEAHRRLVSAAQLPIITASTDP